MKVWRQRCIILRTCWVPFSDLWKIYIVSTPIFWQKWGWCILKPHWGTRTRIRPPSSPKESWGYCVSNLLFLLTRIGGYSKFESIHCANFNAKCLWRIMSYNGRIALKFDTHFGSAAAETPIKFQSDWKSLNLNLGASSLHEILW